MAKSFAHLEKKENWVVAPVGLNLNSLCRRWLKRIRIFQRLLFLKLGWDKRPVFGVLTVNSSCNFQCDYCFADYYKKHDKALPLKRMLQTVDELHEMGVRYLNVHGGEALIRKDIGEILNHALSKGLFVNLITNGAFLRQRWNEVKGVDTMCISLDGKPQNNDRNRGKGTADQAMDAIEFALSQKMTVRVGMTITKHTQGDIDWMMEWARKKRIYVHPFLLFDQGSLPKHLWMTKEENRDAMKKLLRYKQKGYPVFYSIKTLKYALDWPYKKAVLSGSDIKALKASGELRKDFKFIPCNYKKYNVLVENNGTVRTCNVLAKSSYHASFLKGNSVADAKRELHENEDCLHCYHLPQTEMSQLMQLDFIPVMEQMFNQIKEDAKRFWQK